jgi:endonuclease YncB( thermonuclease family)
LVPILLLANSCSAPEPFTAECVAVIDGDTIAVRRNGEKLRIRLEGIDCPERGEPYSRRARNFTNSLAYGKVVELRPKEYDQYGRLVARVIVDGQDVSLALVQAGLARHYKRFSSDPVLADAERKAREERIGIWSRTGRTSQ